MKAPRLIAGLVLLFVLLSMLQGALWHWRPLPGWHPAWWQSQAWAVFGMLITLPSFTLVVLFQNAGVQTGWILWPAMAVGFTLYIAAIYLSVYRIVRLLLHKFGKGP